MTEVTTGMRDELNRLVLVPVRVLPTRRQRFGMMLVMSAALAFSLYVAHVWSPLDATSIILLLLVVGPLCWGLVREVLFLRPRSSYWLEIARDGFRMSSPLAVQSYKWRDMAPFTFEIEDVEGLKEGFVYGHLPSKQFKLHADDFASRLGRDKETATKAFCDFLNKVRATALNEEFDRDNAKLEVPAGLRVSPERLDTFSNRQRDLAEWRRHEPVGRAALRAQKDRLRDER